MSEELDAILSLARKIVGPDKKKKKDEKDKDEEKSSIDYQTLIPSFHFKVAFVDRGKEAKDAPEVPFSEVSGLSFELQTEDILPGGGHDYAIRLPNPPKPKTLLLKRALSSTPPDIITWAKKSLEEFHFEPKDVIVSIVNYDGDAVKAWNFKNAYPVKLAVTDLSATKNEAVIETLELAYSQFTQAT